MISFGNHTDPNRAYYQSRKIISVCLFWLFRQFNRNCLKRRFSFNNAVRAFLYFNAVKHLCIISSKGPLLYFTLRNLWYVIPQLSLNRPRHRSFPSFFEYFFEIDIGRTGLCTQLSFLAGNSRLVLTRYKTNLSRSRSGSKNPTTLFRCDNIY